MKVSLKQSSWAGLPTPPKDSTCLPKQQKYCLGRLEAVEGAAKGFLGAWASSYKKGTDGLDWNGLMNSDNQLKQEVMPKGTDNEQWKGLLMCVMYEALNVTNIRAKTASGTKTLWTENNWRVALRDGVQDDWSANDSGQGMLRCLACLIAALMPNEQHLKPGRGRLAQHCKKIWETVAVDLREENRGLGQQKVEKLEEFLDLIQDLRGDDTNRYDGFGFLLSIYYGLSKCSSYGRNYELTGLLRRRSWDLSSMGACRITKGVFQCSGSSGNSSEIGLNIWTNSKERLVTERTRPKPQPLELSTDKQEEQEELRRKLEDSRRRMQEAVETITQRHLITHEAAQAVVFKTGKSDQLTSEDAHPNQHKKNQSPHGSATPEEQVASSHVTGEVERINPNATATITQSLGQSSQPEQGQQLGGPAGQGEKIQNTPSKQQTPTPTLFGQAENPEPKPSADAQGSPIRDAEPQAVILGTGQIIGAVMSTILSVAAMYGIYRVYRTKRNTRPQPSRWTAPEGTRVAYMSSSP
ncbi:hypothetical protein C922_05347 [Plasmodium inui San Antonio 1]|uniref:Uncharacterized protein n=1 Tax=Plasmodium inui San Antonio 1 TaxID=1237626 RepID=W7AG52_9APIC|nr:hypothetical protein C922_05347 [Plasmodium inui San Antonio 1]EUD64281.1 hypothetical protein C922_05347 [Plasmodium inui San Antonio 1]